MSEMTEQRAREILGDWINGDELHDARHDGSAAIFFTKAQGDYIWLHRGFTADELEAIAFWVRKHAT